MLNKNRPSAFPQVPPTLWLLLLLTQFSFQFHRELPSAQTGLEPALRLRLCVFIAQGLVVSIGKRHGEFQVSDVADGLLQPRIRSCQP